MAEGGYIGVIWHTEGLEPIGDVLAVINPPGFTGEWLTQRDGRIIPRSTSTVFASKEEAEIDGSCQLLAQQLRPIIVAFENRRSETLEADRLAVLMDADTKLHVWQSDVEIRMRALDEGINPFAMGNPYRTLLDAYIPFIAKLRQERDDLERELRIDLDNSSNSIS